MFIQHAKIFIKFRRNKLYANFYDEVIGKNFQH